METFEIESGTCGAESHRLAIVVMAMHDEATIASIPLPLPPRRPVMWVRQCELDAGDEGRPPIPARIASNEEFVPPPQSPQQKEYEARVASRRVLRGPTGVNNPERADGIDRRRGDGR